MEMGGGGSILKLQNGTGVFFVVAFLSLFYF